MVWLTCPQPRAKRVRRVQQVPGPGTQGVWDRVPLAPDQGNPSLSPPRSGRLLTHVILHDAATQVLQIWKQGRRGRLRPSARNRAVPGQAGCAAASPFVPMSDYMATARWLLAPETGRFESWVTSGWSLRLSEPQDLGGR